MRRLLGNFHDEIEAARAYDEAAREMHGQYARVNFPNETDDEQMPVPLGMMGRHEAMRMFGVGLKTWWRWEREGVIHCGTMMQVPSGGRAKVYPIEEIKRLVAEFGRMMPPYPDPNRPGCYVVPLTGQGIRRREAIIDAESLPLVEGKPWCWCDGSGGAVVQARQGETTPLRRIIMGVTEQPSDEIQVAHINGDPLDCRRENLIVQTITQRVVSGRKRRTHHGKPCSSKYKGVSWHPQTGRWRAQIRAEGKTHHLGTFYNEVDAAEAYDEAARNFYREHAWLNFPDKGSPNLRESSVRAANTKAEQQLKLAA